MPDWLLVALGLVTLITGADLLVRGAVWVALVLGIRPVTVGLTVVAFGTSAPELVASLGAAMNDGEGLAMGTVLGSNLANLLLILGLVAVVRPIARIGERISFECRWLVLVTSLTALPFLFWDEIGRAMGGGLFGLLVLFTWQLIVRERKNIRASEARVSTSTAGVVLHLLLLVLGAVGLNYGGGWLVEGATNISLSLGISGVLVGMTVVAVGTSLPELAASIVAARKGHPEICLGNIIGSNIFNIGMVLGVTSMVHPLPVSWAGEGPLMVFGLLAMLFVVMVLRVRQGLPRGVGPFMLLAYLGALAYEIFRQ